MTERLYFTSLSKLKWYCLNTFELQDHTEDACCKMISCSTLEDGRVMVSGTLELRKGVMSQMMFLYDDGRMIIKKEPSAGMIGLQMVAIGLNVFFISGQKCEKYNLESNEIVSVEDMNFNHVKGGACKFNNEVLVVAATLGY